MANVCLHAPCRFDVSNLLDVTMLEVIVYDHDNNSKDDTVGGLRLDKKEMLRIMSQSIGAPLSPAPLCCNAL
jgi:hypothetical protein